jgi:threonine aldolase
VFGDDPSVNALQERIAALLGFEAALFVPTGTQSNLCAILAHCQRGDEYLVGQMAHCYRWEGGGAAVLGSVQPQPMAHQAGRHAGAFRHRGRHQARRRALSPARGCWRWRTRWAEACCPSTTCKPQPRLHPARHGLARHLDGARLFNAAVAQAEITKLDTVPT